jgi:hypothetical protein
MLRKIFDSDNNSGWLISAFAIFAAGLLVSYLAPVVYSLSRFQVDSKIGFSPNEFTIWYQIAAFFVFGIGLYLVYKFSHVAVRVLGGILGIGLFVLISYFSFNSYTYVDEDYIKVGEGFKTLQYTWEEIDELYLYSTGTVNWFELVTNDGEKLEVVFGGLLDVGVQNYIRLSLQEYGVVMIDRT